MKPHYTSLLSIIMIRCLPLFVACVLTLGIFTPMTIYADVIVKDSIPRRSKNLTTGFNQNWSYLPQLDNSVLIENINKLSPKMIRYPGGTVVHSWDWKKGATSKIQLKDEIHPITDVKKLVDQTGVKMMIVLDVAYSTLTNQMQMLDSLHALGVAIDYIELGNELYSRDKKHNYPAIFPDGKAYVDTIAKWAPKLKAAYPKAKIAALLLSRTSEFPKVASWNPLVTNAVNKAKVAIDAYTYHIYIFSGDNYGNRIADFNLAKVPTPGKEIWITEYGNLNPSADANYLTELNKLADYVEANFDITLSHAIIGNRPEHRGKLDTSTHGRTFTPEGKLFLKRVGH